LPQGVLIDDRDISAVLTRLATSPHDQLVLFDNEDVVGIRTQRGS
jgi:arylsulfatase A